MNALVRPINPENPAQLTWPPSLPYEVVMRHGTIRQICEAYNISRVEWLVLRDDPIFRADVARAAEELKQNGADFRIKAKLQANALLERSWQMVHEDYEVVPPSVQADLIKFTIRAAGLSEEKQSSAGGGMQNALQINIHL
jgi:hypothetical protein